LIPATTKAKERQIMATDKLFTVCGTSKLNGEVKVRFANDVMRVKVLAKSGHEDITLIELPEAMLKIDAAKFIQSLDEFQGVAEQAAIADYLDRNDEKPAKAPKAKAEKPAKTATVKAPKAKAPKAKAPVIVDEADDDKPIGYAELEAAVGEAPF
jgi:hypothetical protein